MDIYLPLYLALGLVSGFIAGLLGVGGGLIMVPVLSWAFLHQGYTPEYNIHLALATSLAAIVPTALSSLRAHHAHGAVNWGVVRGLSPGIVAGTLAGALAAAWLPDFGLRLFFTLFLLVAATQMLFGLRPQPTQRLPGRSGMAVAGTIIGMVSSWVGIGGGTLTVPFLVWCNVTLRKAIGTSAAVGLPIAVAGSAGYVVSGHMATGLPAGSLGFIYLPALAGIAIGAWVSAPFGARAAHRWPVPVLKRVFAGLLYALGVRMTYGLFAG